MCIRDRNKTLASQICTEMRGFFPDDAVEYFVSYYDYYQPEAYIPVSYTHLDVYKRQAKVYLARIAETLPSVSNVDSYFKIVKEKYQGRRLIDAARSILCLLYTSPLTATLRPDSIARSMICCTR